MDITKLRSFLVLTETRSFSETAEVLFCSQPAVSKQIESLENELGVPLFNRIRGNITLTIHGHYFKQYAEEMVKLEDNAKEHMKQLNECEEGTLFFGATNFIGVYLMPSLIKKYQEAFPKIQVNMIISSSKKLFQMLEKHEIEFSFLSHYVDTDRNKYISEDYATDHMVLIVPKNHQLASRRKVRLEEIQEEVFIMKEPQSSLSRFIKSKLGEFTFLKTLVISNQEGIKQAVLEGVGITIMSERSVTFEKEAGLVKTLEIEDVSFDREIQLVYNSRRHMTPAAKAFFSCTDIVVKTTNSENLK